MSLAPKILVADDDQALSRTLSWILKENGYEVTTLAGGERLLEHLSAESYDLLLLDIMMPKVDGLQLLGTQLLGRPLLSRHLLSMGRRGKNSGNGEEAGEQFVHGVGSGELSSTSPLRTSGGGRSERSSR